MENASKALLIAAGVMFAVMVLSLIVMTYNQISNYFEAKSTATEIEQLSEFNKIFENYNRKNIRGSDLLGLMNRIIDYNARLSYEPGTNYERIQVTIDISGHVNEFKYDVGDASIMPSGGIIRNTNGESGADNRTLDKQLISISETEKNLITLASSRGIPDVTNTKLQKLSANISNIIVDENGTGEDSVKARQKRASIIKTVLGIEIQLDINAKATTDQDKIDCIKNMATTYYQYTQFKRAYFETTPEGFEYDKDTGRIYKMNFKVTTKNGSVVFN